MTDENLATVVGSGDELPEKTGGCGDDGTEEPSPSDIDGDQPQRPMVQGRTVGQIVHRVDRDSVEETPAQCGAEQVCGIDPRQGKEDDATGQGQVDAGGGQQARLDSIALPAG